MRKTYSFHRKRLLLDSVVLAGLSFLIGGCLADGLLMDLVSSTVAAVWGELVFTGLDFVLPAVTP